MQFVLPPTATGFTSADSGGDDSVDSDAAPGDGVSDIVSPGPGEFDPTLDAGLLPPTGTLSLGNQVWADAGATLVSSTVALEEMKKADPGAFGGGPGRWEEAAKKRPDVAESKLKPPVMLFPKDLLVDDGHHRVELHWFGTGHTKGDAYAWLPKEKILFVGDLAVNWELGNNVGDADADHANWVRALDRVAAWGPASVIPGHGVPGDIATLRGQRAYLAEMLEAVTAGISTHKTAEQVAKEIDLSRHRPFGADPQRTAGQVRTMFRIQSSR